MKELLVIWSGNSGKEYEYTNLEFDYEFEEDLVGNYIFCKKQNEKWIPVYINKSAKSLDCNGMPTL